MVKKIMTLEDFNQFEEEGGLSDSIFKKHRIKIADGETIKVRFLSNGEDENYMRALIHDFGSGPNYRSLLCLDVGGVKDVCPACAIGMPRGFTAAVAVYVYPQGDGKSKPRIGFWGHSEKWAKALATRINTRGITGRDFYISRTGSAFDTEYVFDSDDKSKFKVKLKKSQLSFMEDIVKAMEGSKSDLKKMAKAWKKNEEKKLEEDDDDEGD